MPDAPAVAPPPRPDPVDYLTGRWDGAAVPSGVRGPWPKFSPDGAARPFPGNTIVAHVDPRSDAHAALVALQAALRARPFGHRFAHLPPASLHMTVFEGITEPARGTDRWPEGVPFDAPRDAVTAVLSDRLAGVTLPPLEVRPFELYAGFSVGLTGADAAAEARLRAARDRLAGATGIRRADHETYVFHVTLAYLLTHVEEAEAREIVAEARALFGAFAAHAPLIPLSQAALCDFEDMTAFHPRLPLAG